MPRVVYGVLDVHRSHRIEIPDPAGAAAAGRPDACTGCHVEETRTWAAAAARRLWGEGESQRFARPVAAAGAAGPLTTLLSGDPIVRAVAADALGRAPLPRRDGARALAIRRGLLLDVMTGDDYPAVRHLAWRALGRLTGGAPAALADYDPTGAAPDRRRACQAIAAALPAVAAVAPAPASTARLRAVARQVAIEIGE
jgi:hypothetical protein